MTHAMQKTDTEEAKEKLSQLIDLIGLDLFLDACAALGIKASVPGIASYDKPRAQPRRKKQVAAPPNAVWIIESGGRPYPEEKLKALLKKREKPSSR